MPSLRIFTSRSAAMSVLFERKAPIWKGRYRKSCGGRVGVVSGSTRRVSRSRSIKQAHELESILERFRKRKLIYLLYSNDRQTSDFPGITLVGVLCGDLSLHFPDFRAAERTFQMLTQVAGRTGRESGCGRVILQTYDPNHQAVQCAASHAFEDFFQSDSVLRRELLYPLSAT